MKWCEARGIEINLIFIIKNRSTSATKKTHINEWTSESGRKKNGSSHGQLCVGLSINSTVIIKVSLIRC